MDGVVAGKVLVVDDSATFRRGIAALLEQAGYAVDAVGSGEEAFHRCFHTSYDVVISDVTMGRLSGVQLCRLLSTDPVTRDLPVILLAAADDPRSRFWGRNAGAAAYVSKDQARQSLVPELARVLAAAPPRSAREPSEEGRRAEPLERLSTVLDDLLFRAVVSTGVKGLAQHGDDREELVRRFLDLAREVASYDYLTLSLYGGDAPTHALDARGPWYDVPSPHTLAALELAAGVEVSPIVTHDVPLGGDDPGLAAADRASFPITSAGEILGRLVAVTRDKPLAGEDLATLELLARELGLIAKNVFLLEETRRLAFSDGLTGLANRRRVTERLEVELARARRHGFGCAVAICDVDHFKAVNDRYGHNMGDTVLAAIAKALARTIREVDVASRWGGEEFLVLFPDTELLGARIAAERMRQCIERLPPFPGGPERVTCSFGVAAVLRGESRLELVHRADQALYRAKQGGRNRCEHA